MITKRVSLSPDKSLGYGHLLRCCGKYQSAPVESLEPGDYWSCAYCDRPLMIRIEDQWYEVGNNITI